MKPALITTITRGKPGDAKKRPNGTATAQEMANPTKPRHTDSPFSCAICSSVRLRSVTTALPSPNSLTSVSTPRYTVAMLTKP